MEEGSIIKKSLKQGKGNDELTMIVHLTPEEEKVMEQIKSHSPIDWEGRDLDLLQEARKTIKETRKQEEPQTPIDEPVTRQETTIDERASKKKNYGLWYALVGLLLLFLVYKIVMNSIQKKTDKFFAQSAMSKTKKTINHKGVTFDYPGNWNIQSQQIADEMFFVGGSNEKESEFGVFLTTNTSTPIKNMIDNIITGYATSGRFEDVSYSSIYKTTFNNKEVLAADYSYTSKGKPYYAKLYGFVVNGNSVIVNPVAHAENSLDGDDFKIMENSLKITTLPK